MDLDPQLIEDPKYLCVNRSRDRVEITIRPHTGRAVAVSGLILVLAMAARAIVFHSDDGARTWMTLVIVWSLPVCALIAYSSWLLWGRQEVIATRDEIQVAQKVGPFQVGMHHILRRAEIAGARNVEFTSTFRGSQFISRRLVISGVTGDLIRTISLPDQAAVLRICNELGLVADRDPQLSPPSE